MVLNLRRIRRSRSLTQIALADRAGISYGYIGDIEAGKKFPSATTLQKLCDALEVEPHQLFIPEGPREDGFISSKTPTEKSKVLEQSIIERSEN